MAYLDISTFSGHVKSVDLDKRQALSIGAHPSNDIEVEGDNVEIMHCRISWNKKGFEVVAAGGDGVDVNGTLVQKAQLEAGDIMRIGELDIAYRDEKAAPAAEQEDEDASFGLVPLSGEIDVPLPPAKKEKKEAPKDDDPLTAEEIDLAALGEDVEEPAPKKRRNKEKGSSQKKSTSSDRDNERAEKVAREQKRQKKSRKSVPEPEPDVDDGFDLDELAASADFDEAPSSRKLERSTDAAVDESFEEDDNASPPTAESDKLSLRHRLRSHPTRPGERDAVRSPLVLGLVGGAAVLVLMGLTFYFIISRQTTQARFDEAQAFMEEGKYSQAIKAFDNFIVLFPRDPLVDQAKIQLGISKIDRHIVGGAPDWTEGLKELNGFINARRDLPDFEDHRDGVRRRAEQISEGAAISAGKDFNRDLLRVSDEAKNVLTRFSPEEEQPADTLKRILTSWRASEAAILKHETLTASVAAIDMAIEEKRPMDALVERRELIRRYPDFETDKRIVEKLNAILKTEQELVTRDDEPVDAVHDDHASDYPAPLALTFQTRSRTDEVSVGSNVFGIAKDCVYGVDSITGMPIWRRVIGRDAPFFPVAVNVGDPALLVYSTRHAELQLLNQQTGKLIWRQPQVTQVTGEPTIDEGQVYVNSAPSHLSKVDLASGQITSRLQFSQPVLAPVTRLLDGQHLAVAGNEEVLYTLTNRPLECVAVTYFGHKPGSVIAPMLPMGALVLMCENQPGETSLLRVLDTRSKSGALKQVDSATIPGHVIDTPVIRGRDVFVPSSGERVSSFSASDEPGQTPLTVGPRYEPEGAEQSPMYLTTGPDRTVWMASRYLRKLQLETDAIQPGSKVVNIGIASQPIQLQGRKLYVGRAFPYSTATTLLQTDGEELTSDWQTVVGAQLVGWGDYPEQDGLVAANESGDIFRITDGDVLNGGFLTTTTNRLSVPEQLDQPLGGAQLADGRIAVWCGEPQPQIWQINRVGIPDRPTPLPGPLQCAPTLLGERLLIPIAGKLHLLRAKSGESQVQDFSLPQAGDELPRWLQLATTAEDTAVAATNAGRLIQVRLQTSPKPFLAQAGDLDLGEPLAFQMGVADGMIAAAAGQKLQLIDSATLEPRTEVDLGSPVSNDVWITSGRIFVETGRSELRVYLAAADLENPLRIPLEGVPVAGQPLVMGTQTIVPLSDGRILIVNTDTAEVIAQKTVGQALVGGPRVIGQNILVATLDGSLTRIGTLAGEQGGGSQ